MAIPVGFIESLTRWSRQSPTHLATLKAEMDEIRNAAAANGGKDLTQSTVNGKSWAWSVAMTAADRFIAWETAIARAERRLVRRMVGRFR